MVLEDLLGSIGKRKIYSSLLGMLYVLISYGTAKIFFESNISLAMIFFTTLLLIPSTSRLFSIEEKKERMHGPNKFFKDHYVIMEIFLFLFIGIFIGYLLIGSYSESSIQYQKSFLKDSSIAPDSNIEKLPQFIGITSNNISVIVIAFVLSLFYGAGALFLIVLNASIFASFLLSQLSIMTPVLLLHFIPEVFGFLLAAMAGGVVSKALIKEKIGSPMFKNVVKDSTIMLILSILTIVIAAAIEAFITPGILK